jgi:hypothetical protein
MQSMGCSGTSNPKQESNAMSTSLDLSKLSLMDALDLAILIEEEAHQRYKMFASQVGGAGSSYDAASFFAHRNVWQGPHECEAGRSL